MAKVILTIIIIGAILLLVGGGIWAYFHFATKGISDTEATSDDGTISASATFYDENFNPITPGVTQAFLGANAPQYEYMIIDIKAKYYTATPSATDQDLLNIKLATNPADNGLMANLVKDGGSPGTVILATLPKTQATYLSLITTGKTCTTAGSSDPNCDNPTEVCGGTPLKCYIKLDAYASANVGVPSSIFFATTIQSQIKDALGTLQNRPDTEIKLPSGVNGYDLRGDKCSDGTDYKTCVFARTAVDADKPKYCSEAVANGPVILIDKATGTDGIWGNADDCGCPVGTTRSGETCITNTCPDETNINAFSSASGTYTVDGVSSTLTSGFDSATKTRVYCKSDQTLSKQCDNALTNLCSGIMCVQACQLDYYNNPATGCSGTVEPTTCTYQTYTGGISGCIPDCLGKSTGANDGCGGTCP